MTGYFTGSKYLSESLRSKGYVGEGLPIGRKLSEGIQRNGKVDRKLPKVWRLVSLGLYAPTSHNSKLKIHLINLQKFISS